MYFVWDSHVTSLREPCPFRFLKHTSVYSNGLPSWKPHMVCVSKDSYGLDYYRLMYWNETSKYKSSTVIVATFCYRNFGALEKRRWTSTYHWTSKVSFFCPVDTLWFRSFWNHHLSLKGNGLCRFLFRKQMFVESQKTNLGPHTVQGTRCRGNE